MDEFERRIESFIKYLDTAFSPKPFESITEERRKKLLESQELFQVPYVEAIPKYQPSTISPHGGFSTITRSLNPKMQTIFDNAMEQGLFYGLGKNKLYTHQVEMLERVVEQKMHGLITSGTGSGKTESFLSPIILHILRELYQEGQKYSAPPLQDRAKDWWIDVKNIGLLPPNANTVDIENHQKTCKKGKQSPHVSYQETVSTPQRIDGLRALVMYPMNALVEDQLRRLRMALDSKEMHDIYQNACEGHTPRFGKYNGKTIGGTRKPDHKSFDRNQKEMYREIYEPFQQMYQAIEGVTNPPDIGYHFSNTNKHGESNEDAFTVPSPWGCETRNRWDIHDHVPDIMVTNTSMLSIMLMRNFDEIVWEKTAKYLDSSESARFHLVIDELHLMRSGPGSSNALLIRMLLERLELLPGQKRESKLVLLGSSASMESPQAAKDYLTQAFGLDAVINPSPIPSGLPRPFFLTSGTQKEINICGKPVDFSSTQISNPVWPVKKGSFSLLDSNLFIQLGQITDYERSLNHLTTTQISLLTQICGLASHTPTGDWSVDLETSLTTLNFNGLMAYALQEQLVGGDFRLRTRSIIEIADSIFQNLKPITKQLFSSDHWNAMKGLFRAREIAGSSDSLLSFRLHLFMRNIPGMYAFADAQISYSTTPERTIGEIQFNPGAPVNIGTKPQKPLECLYCDVCGEMFFTGFRGIVHPQNSSATHWEFSLLDADPNPSRPMEQLLAKRVEDRNYSEMAVFRPVKPRSKINVPPPKEVSAYPAVKQVGNVKNKWPNYSHLRSFDTSYEIGGRTQWIPAVLDSRTGDVYVCHQSQLLRKAPQRFDVWGQAFVTFAKRTGGVKSDYSNVDEKLDYVELSKLRGLPEDCPSCTESYQSRNQTSVTYNTKINRGSPLRGFRTGFEEISQINLRALYEGLSENDKKIMAFSDSRDRSERLALKVSQRHHDSLVGELTAQFFIDVALNEPRLVERIAHLGGWTNAENDFVAKGEHRVLDFVKRGDDEHLVYAQKNLGNHYGSMYPFPSTWQPAHRLIQNRFSSKRVPMRLLTGERDNTTTQVVEQVDASFAPDKLPQLALSLLKFGENPFGEEYPSKSQNDLYWRDDSNSSTPKESTTGRYLKPSSAPTDRLSTLHLHLNGKIGDALLSGRSTLEASGIGWVCPSEEKLQLMMRTQAMHYTVDELAKNCKLTKEQFVQVSQGLLRRFLLRRKFPTSWRSPQENVVEVNSSLNYQNGKTYLQKVIDKLKLSTDKKYWEVLADNIYRREFTPSSKSGSYLTSLTGAVQQQTGFVDISQLDVRVADNKDEFVLCPTCDTAHSIENCDKIGICVRCHSSMDVKTTVFAEDIWKRFELPYRIHLESNKPTRLLTDVLTGNTTDPARTQRRFKDILMPNVDDSLIDAIDVLSVTTTTEVGVDLGSLSTVYQSNMPPQRFNYQQRVGRAGRRGQSFSIAQTMCRDNTHDAYYFKNPHRITGDLSPDPVLNVTNEYLLKRMLARMCLRSAFLEIQRTGDPLMLRHPKSNSPDVHGEFGLLAQNTNADPNQVGILDVGLWKTSHGSTGGKLSISAIHGLLSKNGKILQNWLATNSLVDDYADALLQPNPTTKTAIKSSIVSYIRNELFNEIVNVIFDVLKLELPDAKRPLNNDESQLALTLAEKGLLPIEDMPTNARSLYYGASNKTEPRTMTEVQRDIAQAIGMFAPATKNIVNKNIVEAVGLTSRLEIDKLKFKTHNPSNNEDTDVAYDYEERMIIDPETNALLTVGQTSTSYSGSTSAVEFTAIRPAGFRAVFHIDTSDPWDDRGESNGGARLYYDAAASPSASTPGKNMESETLQDTVYLINDRNQNFYRFIEITEIPADKTGPRNFKRAYNQLILDNGKDDGKKGDSYFYHFYQRKMQKTSPPNFSPETLTGLPLGRPQLSPSGAPVSKNAGVALVAPKRTDVTWFHPEQEHSAIQLDPWSDKGSVNGKNVSMRPGIAAAYRSAAYMLRAAFCDNIDIDPLEIELSLLAPVEKSGKTFGRVVLNDKLQNGTGYSRQLHKEMPALLEKFVDTNGGTHTRTGWIDDFFKPHHFDNCHDSCNECIRYYSNSSEHSLMDWRVGLSLLRILNDPKEHLFADSKNLKSDLAALPADHEMKNWISIAQNLQTLLESQDSNYVKADFNDLPAIIDAKSGNPKCFIFVHPLWRLPNQPGGIPGNVIQTAMAEYYSSTYPTSHPGMKLIFIDTFNAHRRISWSRVQLS